MQKIRHKVDFTTGSISWTGNTDTGEKIKNITAIGSMETSFLLGTVIVAYGGLSNAIQ